MSLGSKDNKDNKERNVVVIPKPQKSSKLLEVGNPEVVIRSKSKSISKSTKSMGIPDLGNNNNSSRKVSLDSNSKLEKVAATKKKSSLQNSWLGRRANNSYNSPLKNSSNSV